jgi:alpha-glucosidase
MRLMEFNYPDQGYAGIIDQFLLGDRLLVAPVVNKGVAVRKVVIPKGRWRSFEGKIISGPRTVDIKITLDDLPFFELIQ